MFGWNGVRVSPCVSTSLPMSARQWVEAPQTINSRKAIEGIRCHQSAVGLLLILRTVFTWICVFVCVRMRLLLWWQWRAHTRNVFFFFFASFYKLIKISLSLAICLWYLIYTFYIWEKRSQQVNRVWGHVIAVREVILAPGNWTILTQRSEEDNVSTGRSRLLALCLTSCISPSNVNNNIKRGTILQWEAESYQMASHEQKTNSSNCTFLLGSLSPS